MGQVRFSPSVTAFGGASSPQGGRQVCFCFSLRKLASPSRGEVAGRRPDGRGSRSGSLILLALGYRQFITAVVVRVARMALDPRRRMLHITRTAVYGGTRSLRCSSFPQQNRFAGFCRGPHIGSRAFLLMLLALGYRQFITAVVVRVARMALDPMQVDFVIIAKSQ